MKRWIGALALAGAAFSTAAPARAACGPDALGVSRTVEIGAPATAIGLKTYPRALKLSDGEFVLTFDDGPNPPTTNKALKALAAECVKATFFLIGRNAQAAPETVRREIAAGHTVGHHTFSHPAVTLRGLGDAAARADIDKGFAADDSAAYGVAGAGPKTPFFRFPGFADTPALVAWLEGRGVTIFGADLWASDWLPMTPKEELDLLLGRMEKARKGVILLHDIHSSTVNMLPDLLREMKKRGFRIVHMVPGAGPTPVEPAPAGWTSETERALAAVHKARKNGAASAPAKIPGPL